MTVQHRDREAEADHPAAVGGARVRHESAPSDLMRRFLAMFAVHDLLLLGYYGTVSTLLALVGPERATEGVTRRVLLSVVVVLIGCLVGRGPHDLPQKLRSLAYRAAMVFVILDGYLMLRDLLPALRADAVDAQLYALDMAIFGVEPAFWLERYSTPQVVEYFAFFYFSYFGICVFYMLMVIGPLNLRPDTSRFAIGTVLVLCLGQLGYVMVPAFGPIKAMAGDFQAPLQGGFWWDAVLKTVAAGSAQKDVFPSLHTAMPCWFTLYAIGRADNRMWRLIAIVTGVFAGHIVISTMLLRWHYLIDVIAGLGLAAFAAWASRRLMAWESVVRGRLRAPHAWSFEGPASRTEPVPELQTRTR